MFLLDFLPELYPESAFAVNRIQPEMVEEYIGGWLAVSEYINHPDDLKEAGLALRHFFQFLASVNRIEKSRQKSLSKNTHIRNFDEIFSSPKDKTLDKTAGLSLNLNAQEEEAEAMEKAFLKFTDDLSKKLSEKEKVPPFAEFLYFFLREIFNNGKTYFRIKEGDLFLEDTVNRCLEKSGFEPLIDKHLFINDLIWYMEQFDFLYRENSDYYLVDDVEVMLEMTKKEIWRSGIYDLEEMQNSLPFLDFDFDLTQQIKYDLRQIADKLRELPVNMWITIPENQLLSAQKPLSEVAFNLTSNFSDADNNPYLHLFCQLSYWTGMIDFEKKNKKIQAVIKTRMGHWFFHNISLNFGSF